jgi:hypothetical protein
VDNWVRVECPECKHTLYYAKPGSTIQAKCPRKKCPVTTIESKITDEESVEHTAINRRG